MTMTLPLTCHHSIVFEGTSHNHDGIVEGAFSLLQELLSAATQNNGARLGLRTPHEQVESVVEGEEKKR